MYWIARSPRLRCRLRGAFEDQFWPLNWLPRRCHFTYQGEDGERGIYVCWCGASRYGFRFPVVIEPGETVGINFCFTFKDGEKQ